MVRQNSYRHSVIQCRYSWAAGGFTRHCTDNQLDIISWFSINDNAILHFYEYIFSSRQSRVCPDTMVHFDAILQDVGSFGHYQKCLLFVMLAAELCLAFHSLSPVFTAYTPPYECARLQPKWNTTCVSQLQVSLCSLGQINYSCSKNELLTICNNTSLFLNYLRLSLGSEHHVSLSGLS